MASSKILSDDCRLDKGYFFPELSVRKHEYEGRFPSFYRPKIIGYFSLDNSRDVVSDHSRLKFVRQCEDCSVNFDLNRLTRQADDKVYEEITYLLKYLSEQETRLDYVLKEPVPSLEEAKIIIARHFGCLSNIADTPYGNRYGWRIVSTLYNGKIYLYQDDDEDEPNQQFPSWGYKFQQYVLADTPSSSPDPTVPKDETTQFYLVLTTQLNSHKLLYRAKVDGILCEPGITPPPDGGHEEVIEYLRGKKFVALKTERNFRESNTSNYRKFKARRRWWHQSFLSGVETVLAGLRDEEGIVNELKVFKVSDLPNMCKEFWSAEVCFNFLDKFLTHVKRCHKIDLVRKHGEAVLTDIIRAPTSSLLFEWSPYQKVKVTEFTPTATGYDILKDRHLESPLRM